MARGPRRSEAMARAMALVMEHGAAPMEAARACGVRWNSLYVALKRAGHVIDSAAAAERRARALADPERRAKRSAALKRAWAARKRGARAKGDR